MSGVLFLVLVAGFAPTLYLRAFFDVPPIPIYLYVHGAVITCWFLWLITQTSLVAIGRTDVHRRIGFGGAVLALAVVFAGPMATMGMVPRLPAMGLDLETNIYFITWVVWGNFISVSAFAVLVLAGILLRRQSDVHKRLMLLASLSIISPALARIAFWPVFEWIEEIPFVVSGSLVLLATLGIHDLIVNKRLHKATIVGGVIVVVTIFAPLVIANADFAQTFVRGLG